MRNTKSRAASRGFSLVEILIVIAIIAVLAGLLIPAIASVRNASRRTQDSSNIRQSLLAMQNYYSLRNKLPTTSGELNSNWFACNYNGGNGSKATSANLSTITCNSNPSLYAGFKSIQESLVVKKDLNLSYSYSINDIVSFKERAEEKRTDWVDGSFFFQLAPYLGEEPLYTKSEGPLFFGTTTVTATATNDKHLESQLNRGFQAWRTKGSVIKCLQSPGDPSVQMTYNMSPISYRTTTGLVSDKVMETGATSFITAIAPAYSNCFGNSYPNVSWATSDVYNYTDTTKNIRTTTYGPVSIGSGTARTTTYDTTPRWLGATSPTGACPVTTPGVTFSSDPEWGDTCDYSKPGAGTFPVRWVNPAGTPETNCVANDPRLGCHLGEFYYVTNKASYGGKMYYDENPPLQKCQLPLQAMSKGAIQLGMLDGSVREVSNTASAQVWLNLARGYAGTGEE